MYENEWEFCVRIYECMCKVNYYCLTCGYLLFLKWVGPLENVSNLETVYRFLPKLHFVNHQLSILDMLFKIFKSECYDYSFTMIKRSLQLARAWFSRNFNFKLHRRLISPMLNKFYHPKNIENIFRVQFDFYIFLNVWWWLYAK